MDGYPQNHAPAIPCRKSLRYAGFIAGRETCTGTIRGFRWQGARQESQTNLTGTRSFETLHSL